MSSPNSRPVSSTSSTGNMSRTIENTVNSSTREEAPNPQLPPPPPYTAVPNQRAGEATVEYGPLRPYRPAPPPLLVPVSTPQQNTLGPWDNAETALPVAPNAQLLPSSTGSAALTGGVPPPRHPSQRPHPSSPSNQRPSSFSERDGSYASAPVGLSLDNPSSTSVPPRRRHSGHSNEHIAQNRYSPPRGSPPPLPSGRSPGPSGPDDGKPTRSPIGGHPFMNGGKILVYPTGYECHKCNTGFTSF